MRKGAVIGAIIGFLVGLHLQASGTLLTGMAARSLNPEATQFLAASFAISLFVAALFGAIGAFVGALLQEVLHRR